MALHQVVSEHTFIRVLEGVYISGIRAGVPERVDRSPKLRQFAPGPWEDMKIDRWIQRGKVDLVEE